MPMSETDQARADQIRARADAATEVLAALRAAMEARRVHLAGGWLCEDVNECTCGQPAGSAYGHESGCGLEPICGMPSLLDAAEDVPWLLDRLAAATAEVQRLKQNWAADRRIEDEQRAKASREAAELYDRAHVLAAQGRALQTQRDEMRIERDEARAKLAEREPMTAEIGVEIERHQLGDHDRTPSADCPYCRVAERDELRARLAAATERADKAEAAVADDDERIEAAVEWGRTNAQEINVLGLFRALRVIAEIPHG